MNGEGTRFEIAVKERVASIKQKVGISLVYST